MKKIVFYGMTMLPLLTACNGLFCDHCMQCESCGNRIQNAVYAGKGIRTVKVRAEENIIEVSYNPK
ncbi:heavy-metal-associated domain-containing protein, partial [Escherichia coli]|uniref:heavy-metal-associated domain-containing protein n=1 Tax=Escherichia coli TaxID=562 RepID=UPI001958A3F9